MVEATIEDLAIPKSRYGALGYHENGNATYPIFRFDWTFSV